MAGRKGFVAGEILTASDVNAFLMDQVVQVYDDATARDTALPSPIQGQIVYLKDADTVQKYNGADFVPVGGLVATESVLKTDTFSTSSSSLTNITGFEVTITPSSDTNKILLVASFGVGHSGGNTSFFDFAEGTTSILTAAANTPATTHVLPDSASRTVPTTIHGLHSPNVDTPITYRVRCGTTGGTVFVGRPGTSNTRNTASMLTAIEVAV